MNPPTLETQRLILRPWQDQDIAPFAAMNSDPKVMEFFPNTLTAEDTWHFVQFFKEELAQRGYGLFACVLKETQEFIGSVGLHYQDFEAPFTPCVEIGWRLGAQFWGQGYATEAARAVLKFGFEECGLGEIVSLTTLGNIRSRRVMEKLGLHYNPQDDFEHPRVPQGHPLRKHVLYRISKELYDAQKHSEVG